MDKEKMDIIYISIRPYLDNAHMISGFIEENIDKDPEDLITLIKERMSISDVVERTDYQILLNALEKDIGT